MPLLDHFHPPLFPLRKWDSFHSRWTNSIADQLNESLPKRYFAEVQTYLGTQVEADVAEFSLATELDGTASENGAGGVAVHAWAPPVAAFAMPALFPDCFQVLVRDEADTARLVAVVEIVSPSNKDRPDTRMAFAGKSAAYLQFGIGLIVVDIVTSRRFNLHNEMIQMMGLSLAFSIPADANLYAVAYRPIRRGQNDEIDAWPMVLSVGSDLPVLPLALRGAHPVALDLNAAYEDACRRSRI